MQLCAADTATGVTLSAQQPSGELIMEPGPIEVSARSSSSDIRSTASFTVTGKTFTVRGEDRKFFSVATVGSSGTQPMMNRVSRTGL